MDQQKLKMHAEIDRLVDEKCLSYNETVDICLKIVGTEKKLFNTSAGKVTNSCKHVRTCSIPFSLYMSCTHKPIWAAMHVYTWDFDQCT